MNTLIRLLQKSRLGRAASLSISERPRYKKSERGQAIILIVFSIIGLVGMTALAIDGGNALLDRRRTETAASAAALTAALTRIEGGDWRAAALATAKANGYNNNGVTSIIEMNTPPLTGPFVGNSEYIEVIITSHMATFFGSVIGVPQVTNVARAVTRTKPSEYGPMFDGYALISLMPHSLCEEDKRRSFVLQQEATIKLSGGGIFVNSDNPDCAFIQFGSGSIRVQDKSPITVVGGAQIQKTKLISPATVQTGAVPVNYPPAFVMPKIGCGSNVAAVDEFSPTTMTAGTWDGEETFPPVGVLGLDGGTYCIRGDVVLKAGTTLEGKGVTLILEDGNFLVKAGAQVALTAPQTGPAKGLLIYMPIQNEHRIALNGAGADSRFRGTILAPAGDVILNGMDSKYGYHSQIIGHTINVTGQDVIVIDYSNEENYYTYKMPEVLLSQ
jgi:Flp pilus assembly protein TadG